jgi:hypothetical protein
MKSFTLTSITEFKVKYYSYVLTYTISVILSK